MIGKSLLACQVAAAGTAPTPSARGSLSAIVSPSSFESAMITTLVTLLRDKLVGRADALVSGHPLARPLPSWRDALARIGRLAVLAGIALLATACATLPPPAHPAPTQAIADYAQTPLGEMTRAVLPTDGRSGFLLQPYGPNAFATRLALTRLATRSLDVQYYLLQ